MPGHRITFVCSGCGTQFSAQASRRPGKTAYCSDSCKIQSQSGSPVVSLLCAQCGAAFSRLLRIVRRTPDQTSFFCSRQCRGAHYRGEHHPGWKGGLIPYNAVYTTRYIAPYVYVPEHQRVLAQVIGIGPHRCHWCGRLVDWLPFGMMPAKALIPDHVDGNPSNNAPQNLVPSCTACNTQRMNPRIIQEGETYVLNHLGQKRRAEWRRCQQCEQPFLFVNRGGGSKGTHCSPRCGSISRHQRARFGTKID
jgi:hypothetical protein